ncbi:helix-turn-helix domain-containing protein [Neoroseomonas lacus]|uniref:DNA-binding protein n=1 Tax=Neoroseomonas lacus TaxID=287609 RepID=A0A917NKN4_9PROT|nr:helix-turn-helix domain-containing protein [Neoroseomonas lacus]GGJ05048.1 hypothetical protein GCM10011320_09970 [Neoroseomonas lacus]
MTTPDSKQNTPGARRINPLAFSYTLTDAAEMSGLSIATLRRRQKDGALAFVNAGKRTLVNGDSLRKFCGATAAA